MIYNSNDIINNDNNDNINDDINDDIINDDKIYVNLIDNITNPYYIKHRNTIFNKTIYYYRLLIITILILICIIILFI